MTSLPTRRTAAVPTGWCSWYELSGGVTEADMIANLEFCASHFDRRFFGYVQLDDLVRVESRLVGDPETFRIGMALQLVPLVDVDAEPIYAFAPVHEETST